jgi:hypothetical protein
MPRKKKTDEMVRKPLLRFERVMYEKASFRLRQDVLQQIAEYVLYVKEMTGDEPTPDELVDRGMQRLFVADRGFHEWRQDKQKQNGLIGQSKSASGTRSRTDTSIVCVPFANALED